jgi:hypothetical protein
MGCASNIDRCDILKLQPLRSDGSGNRLLHACLQANYQTALPDPSFRFTFHADSISFTTGAGIAT